MSKNNQENNEDIYNMQTTWRILNSSPRSPLLTDSKLKEKKKDLKFHTILVETKRLMNSWPLIYLVEDNIQQLLTPASDTLVMESCILSTRNIW